MGSYADTLTAIAKFGALAKQDAPDVEEFSADHVKGTQALILDAAAAYTQGTKNTQDQQAAIATAELAAAVVPDAFALFSWFKKHNAAHHAAAAQAAQAAQG